MWHLDDPGADPYVYAPGSPKERMTKLAIADFETTGLDPEHDEAIELHVQIWTTEAGLLQGPENIFHRLWIPQGEPHTKAAAVNGYTREAWEARGARALCTADMYELNKFLAGHAPDMWAGHNIIGFDLPFLRSTYRRVRVKPHTWRGDYHVVYTMALAAPLLFTGEIQGVSLEKLAAHFQIVNPAPHTAPGDVYTCATLLERLCARYLRP